MTTDTPGPRPAPANYGRGTVDVRFVDGWNTAQPITFFARYDVGGADVVVRFGGPAQTWDCQPYRRPSRILTVGGVPPTPEQERLYGEALRCAFPGAECFNDLERRR